MWVTRLLLEVKRYDRGQSVPQDAAFTQTFAQENHRFLLQRFRLLISIGVYLYLGFWLLDRVLFPDLSLRFLTVRIAFCGLAMLAAMATYGEWGKRHALALSFLSLQAICFSISMMTVWVGGFSSVYFVGDMLVVLATGMFIPWHPRVSLTFGLIVLFFYVAMNLVYHGFSGALTPFFFLFSAAALTSLSAASTRATRARELAIRIQVEEAHAELKRQLKVASQIQSSLLPPRQQSFDKMTVDALYQPCDQLSGDFFDTFNSGGWFYTYLADVTSHGLVAAQATYLVKEIFKQTMQHHSECDLATLFDKVRTSYVQYNLDYDLGLQLIRLQPSTGQLECVTSNAPEPMLMHSNGSSEALAVLPSPLISAQLSSNQESCKVFHTKMQIGEWLYMFTDGALELKANHQFSGRKLAHILKVNHDKLWPQALLESLKTENGADQFADDVTIVRIGLHDSARGRSEKVS